MRRTALFVAAPLLLLAACGDGGHAVCVDEKSTQAYTQTFITDMIAAAGKNTPEQQKQLQADFEGIAGADPSDFGAFCTRLDALRTKYGI